MFDIEKFVQKVQVDDTTSVYFLDVTNIDVETEIQNLPKIRKEKVLRLNIEKEQKLVIGAYLLLKLSLKDHHLDIINYDFGYEESGKPFLKGCPLFFSISHSGKYAAIVLSNKPVGIDIQKIRKFNPDVLKFVANAQELKFFNDANDKTKAFYKIWCSKEAYLKKIGIGLTNKIKNIVIDTKQIKEINLIDDYCVIICN